MRTIGAAAILWCALAGVLQPAYAQEACVPGPGKLGIARTLNVNTANGPHFGSQYRGSGFLADGEVVLTFDDGPSRSYTRAILDALAAQCTKATFFMLGQMALADPQLVKEVARQGHTVATHTWSHANLQALPQAKAQDEIELGLSAVQHALGKPVAPFFRFPYLRDTPLTLSHLKSRQLAAFGIDIDSRDFETKDASLVYDRVMRELAAKRKGIVLFHDIHASTARAVPRILEELRAQGFRVVHVVPKAGAETLAEYDTLAQEAAERRRVTAAAGPLAKRAITWPSSISPNAHGSVAPPASPAPAVHSASPREDWTADFWRQSQ
ncbi:MAG TPA: polysaccharide deacetylase family protein [Hyphomicrobiaceae bacterium]|jgi:peptidoglycan/xylan/chitin deacetylase (PgdA/CDA1 family)